MLDAQAPRTAYMLNEALAPRGRFGFGVPGNAIKSLQFPPFSAAMVTMLGISQIGYITAKATTKTPSDR